MAITFKVYDGDVVINPSSGRPSTITGLDKLRQDIYEFLSVQVLPSGFGAGLDDLVGMVSISSTMMTSLISRQIYQGIDAFILLQSSDVTPRSSDERVTGVSNVIVKVDTTDPTQYYVSLNVLTESGKTLPIQPLTFGA